MMAATEGVSDDGEWMDQGRDGDEGMQGEHYLIEGKMSSSLGLADWL